MLNTINVDTINSIVSSLQNAISTLKTESANIEEKYKKMMEEEKSSISEALKEAEEQHHYWLVVRGDLPAEEKKTRKPRAKKAEVSTDAVVTEDVQDDKVVDTIFPENNDGFPETLLPVEEEPEVDSAGFTSEDNVPFVEENSEESEEDSSEEEETVIEDISWDDNSSESIAVNDDDENNDVWPDTPDEF